MNFKHPTSNFKTITKFKNPISKRIWKFVFLGFLICFEIGCLRLEVPALADNVSFTASVDKNTVALDDLVNYTLTITGVNTAVDPTLPQLTNLLAISRSQSTSLSLINGLTTAANALTLLLRPQETGVGMIGPASVIINGRLYSTKPIKITITGPTGGSRRRQAASSWDDLFAFARTPMFSQEQVKDPVLAKTKVSRSTAYVNQPVMLTFTFYHRVNLMSAPSYQPPETTGFWSINLPASQALYEETVNGLKYMAQDFKTMLFPTAAGKFQISPAIIRAQVDPLSQPMTIKTDPIAITVLPLPENGKPTGFSGAVGHYQLATVLSPQTVKRGQPFKIMAKVFGDGNIQAVSEPLLQLGPEFQRLSSNSSEKVTKGYNAISGTKTFEFAILPLKAGQLTIEPLLFSYFDPDQRKYLALKSPAFSLNVLPSNIPLPSTVRLTTSEPASGAVKISFNWRGILKRLWQLLWQPILFGLLGLGVLFWLAKIGWARYQMMLQTDAVKLRRRLKKARKMLAAGRCQEALAEIYNTVRSLGRDEEEIISQFIAECDLLRFTPGTLDQAKVSELLWRAKKLYNGS